MTLLWLFLPASKSKTTPLTYTAWRAKVSADQVKTATIDPDGNVTGKLVDGSSYTARLPVAVKDDALASELDQHHVTVDAVGTSTSVWTVIGGLLPFLLLLGVYFWISRGAKRQLGGGLMGLGASKAKIYDEQRPTTRFSDVAGYDGAKREISEVVDFLRCGPRPGAVMAIPPVSRCPPRRGRALWPATGGA
jgi:cell division protease FtsH